MVDSELRSPASDAEREIMAATFEVLATGGYAELTTRAVAEESGESQGMIRHYYETRAELLATFVGNFAERRAPTVDHAATDSPVERLRAALDVVVPASLSEDRRRYEVVRLELESAAVRREALYQPLEKRDRRLRDELAGILADGTDAETDAFAVEDPQRAADRLLTVGDGALRRAVALDQPESGSDECDAPESDRCDALESGRATLDALVEGELLPDDEAAWSPLLE